MRNDNTTERGAALVVSLALIAALAILSVAGMQEVAIETAMTRNLLHRTGTSAAANSGLALAISGGPFVVGMNDSLTRTMGSAGEYSVTINIRHVGSTLPPQGFSLGASSQALVAHHFEITAQALGPGRSQSSQLQGLYVLGTQDADL